MRFPRMVSGGTSQVVMPVEDGRLLLLLLYVYCRFIVFLQERGITNSSLETEYLVSYVHRTSEHAP